MANKILCRTCGLALSVVLFGSAAADTSIRTDFTTSVDGWMQTGASVFQHNAAGGNPDGFLFIDNSEGPITFLFAPAQFLGNLTAYDGGTVSFDGNMLGIGGSPFTQPGNDYGHLRISGAGMAATLDLLPAPGQPAQGSWTTFSAPLTAAAWGQSQANWSSMLGNVTEVRLSVEAMFGAEVQGVDNFTVTAIPEPQTYLLLAAGLGLVLAVAARNRR